MGALYLFDTDKAQAVSVGTIVAKNTKFIFTSDSAPTYATWLGKMGTVLHLEKDLGSFTGVY